MRFITIDSSGWCCGGGSGDGLGALVAGYRMEVEEACESAAGRILDAANSFAFIVVATELADTAKPDGN